MFAFIRFGTCGGLTLDTPAGCIVVAAGGSGNISRNPDAFSACYDDAEETVTSSESENVEAAYRTAKLVPASKELSELALSCLGEQVGAEHLRSGVNVTAESFYSSQGRIDPNFDDLNLDTHKLLVETYPGARSLEMETFWLLHLAKCCKVPVKATAACIVLSCRPTGNVMDGALLDNLERKGGLAMLQALTQVTL